MRVGSFYQYFVVLALRREYCDLVFSVLHNLEQLQVRVVWPLADLDKLTDKPVLGVDQLDRGLISHKDVRHLVSVEVGRQLSADDARLFAAGPLLLFSFTAVSVYEVEMGSLVLEG